MCGQYQIYYTWTIPILCALFYVRVSTCCSYDINNIIAKLSSLCSGYRVNHTWPRPQNHRNSVETAETRMCCEYCTFLEICPLLRGNPLLGGSVKRGSTVIQKKFLSLNVFLFFPHAYSSSFFHMLLLHKLLFYLVCMVAS